MTWATLAVSDACTVSCRNCGDLTMIWSRRRCLARLLRWRSRRDCPSPRRERQGGRWGSSRCIGGMLCSGGGGGICWCDLSFTPVWYWSLLLTILVMACLFCCFGVFCVNFYVGYGVGWRYTGLWFPFCFDLVCSATLVSWICLFFQFWFLLLWLLFDVSLYLCYVDNGYHFECDSLYYIRPYS